MNEFQTDTSHCPVPSDSHPLYSSISNPSLHEARSRSRSRLTVSSNSTLTLDSLLILQQNVRANKLLTELTLLKHSPDLFLISDPPKCIREGWCPPGFRCVLPHGHCGTGHCCIVIKDYIAYNEVFTSSNRVCALTIKVNSRSIGFVCCYIQHTSAAGLQHVKDTHLSLESQGVSSVIGGDFNSHSSLWGPISTPTCNSGRQVENWLEHSTLSLHNHYPCIETFRNSRNERSWIDLTCTSDRIANWIQNWIVTRCDEDLSDHNLISFRIVTEENVKLSDRIQDWRNCNWDSLSLYLERDLKNEGWLDFEWDKITTGEELDTRILELEDAIRRSTRKLIPMRRKTSMRKHWWNPELTRLHRDLKRKQRRLWKLTSKGRPPDVLESARIDRDEAKKNFQKEANAAKTKSWRIFLENTDKTNMWSNFKRITKQKKRVDLSYVTDLEDQVRSSPLEVANALAEKFIPDIPGTCSPTEAMNDDEPMVASDTLLTDLPIALTDFPEVTESEIVRGVFGNKPYGAVGVDRIPNQLYRIAFPFLKRMLLGIVNCVLRTSHHCHHWKTAAVVAVPKTTQHLNSVKSLRPISLLCALGKIVEKIITDRLAHWAESNMVLSDKQFGFRKQKSCETALANLIDRAESCFDQGQDMLVASLDLSSAFDTINGSKLLSRLRDLEVPPYLLSWLQNYVNDRHCVIKVADQEFSYPVLSACPQGSPLSPLLFNLYVNQVLEQHETPPSNTPRLSPPDAHSSQSGIQAYADDLLVWTTGPLDTENQSNLQSHLDKIHLWTKEAGLMLNPTKCVTIRLSRKRGGRPPLKMLIDGTELVENSVIKYLGLQIDRKLQWREHVKFAVQKANKRLLTLRKISGHRWGIDSTIMAKLVKMGVLPTLYYAAPIWASARANPQTLRSLEVITRQLALIVTGCLKTTAYAPCYALSGLYEPDLEISRRLIVFGRRLHSIERSCIQRTTRSQFRLNTEAKRIARQQVTPDILLSPSQIAWGIAPYESNLWIRPGNSKLPSSPSDGKYYCILKKLPDSLCFAWSWRHACVSQEGSFALPLSLEEDQAEAIGILLSLPRIYAQEAQECRYRSPDCTLQRLILHSKNSGLRKYLLKLQNIPRLAYLLQLWIRNIQLNGIEVSWLRPDEFCDLSVWRRTKIIAKQCNSHLPPQRCEDPSSSEGTLSLEDLLSLAGLCNKKMKKILKDYSNAYMNATLLASDVGLATTDLIRICPDFKFTGNSFPAHGLDRTTGSALNQFLTAHMPANTYLERFQLPSFHKICCHDHWNELDNTTHDFRDHILMQCDDQHIQALRVATFQGVIPPYSRCITWPTAMSNINSLASFAKAILKIPWFYRLKQNNTTWSAETSQSCLSLDPNAAFASCMEHPSTSLGNRSAMNWLLSIS